MLLFITAIFTSFSVVPDHSHGRGKLSDRKDITGALTTQVYIYVTYVNNGADCKSFLPNSWRLTGTFMAQKEQEVEKVPGAAAADVADAQEGT